MLNNLLSDYQFKLFGSGIETGLFVLILGMLVVFFGIAIIVAVITLIGKAMTAVKNKKSNAPAKTEPAAATAPAAQSVNGVSPEVAAVITAAVNAYYEKNDEKCEFAVKKLKKRG